MNSYFSPEEKLYELTERYPELIPVLSGLGFLQLKDETLRRTLGKTLSLGAALKSRGLDYEVVSETLLKAVEESKREETGTIRMEGLLPCPIRGPITDALNAFAEQSGQKIAFDLQAASLGFARMKEHIEAAGDASELSDIYLTAGYGLFFDRELFARFPERLFVNPELSYPFSAEFDNETFSVKDPAFRCLVIGAVPAVFGVNLNRLCGRAVPESWAQLLQPEYENSVAVPEQDADLFEAIMLSIRNAYGREGIEALARSSRRSMHPAQMVKTAGAKKDDAPLVSVLPYFFASMFADKQDVRIVWPRDGAILSPIILMVKHDSLKKAAPLIAYLCGAEFAALISADGRFPATHAGLPAQLSAEQRFLWPGFSVLNGSDVPAFLAETVRIYQEAGV